MGIEFDINRSFIISRKGLVLTLSILPCPQGRISCSTPCRKMIECPYSTKTREVLGNPSPTPERFPKGEARGKSGGRRGWIFQYLPSFGGVRTFSRHHFFYKEWIRKSFPVGREGLTVLKSTLPCWWWEIAVSLSTNSIRRQDPNTFTDTELRALSEETLSWVEMCS